MNSQKSTIKILMKLLLDARNDLLNAGVIDKSETGCCIYPD